LLDLVGRVHVPTPHTSYHCWLLRLLGTYRIPRHYEIHKACWHIRGDYVFHTNLTDRRLTPDNRTCTKDALGSRVGDVIAELDNAFDTLRVFL